MNVRIARQGQQFGPYPVEQIEPMLRAGNIGPTDYIFLDGAKDWIPLGEYLASINPSTPPSAVPPAGPSPGTASYNTQAGGAQILLDRKIVAGTLGFTEADLERELMAGGRFVTFQYCISVVVLTFKRQSDVVFLKGGADGFSDAFGNSLISLIIGWWGFPWGPIWTIASLVTNARGGNDCTPQVLAAMFGPNRARALASRRTKPASAGIAMNIFRVALIAVPLLLIGLVVQMVSSADAQGRNASTAASASASGEAGFEAANHLIDFNKGTTAFGNTPRAIAVAAHFSAAMKARREAEFSAGKSGAASATKSEFLTYCKLDEGRCVILVHVPELRRFDADAKEAMAHLAWECAEATLKEKGEGNAQMALTVGVRGMLLFDRVLSGKYVDDPSQRHKSVTNEVTGSTSKDALYAFFRR